MKEITIPKSILTKLNGNDIHFGLYVLDTLHAAGVPAEGTIWPRCASSGRLECEVDDLSDEIIWRWYP